MSSSESNALSSDESVEKKAGIEPAEEYEPAEPDVERQRPGVGRLATSESGLERATTAKDLERSETMRTSLSKVGTRTALQQSRTRTDLDTSR